MKKGFFIVIEGIDGSGKATQTELLKNRLEASAASPTVNSIPPKPSTAGFSTH